MREMEAKGMSPCRFAMMQAENEPPPDHAQILLRKKREEEEQREDNRIWIFILRVLALAVFYYTLKFYWNFFSLDTRVNILDIDNIRSCVTGLVSMRIESCMYIRKDIYQLFQDVSLAVLGGFTASEVSQPKSRFIKKFKIAEEQKDVLIQKYRNLDAEIAIHDDCFIGVGYNACTDINFKASELIALIEPQILELEKEMGEEIEPKVHSKIETLKEFIETFAYQFMNGANAERVCNSKELFYFFYDTIKEKGLTHREELGGHSPVWALRSQREQCRVFIAAQSNPVTESQLFYNSTGGGKSTLVDWPKEKIENVTASVHSSESKQKQDLHLVFEYAEGDTILGGRFRASRSNRFYFVHDPNGGQIRQLEAYH
mmetsp:Transcript_7455/g.12602  ORF Transcript_7455/g.12602 Transcript_7455/m.12602 type:complete len:373 (-) Transcript_7455:848-1966(-)